MPTHSLLGLTDGKTFRRVYESVLQRTLFVPDISTFIWSPVFGNID